MLQDGEIDEGSHISLTSNLLSIYLAAQFDLQSKLNNIDAIRRNLHNRVMQLTGNIRVFVRVRPALQSEQGILQAAQENADNLMSKSMNKKGLDIGGSVVPFEFPELSDRSDVVDGNNDGKIDSSKTLLEMTEPYRDRGGLSNRRRKHRFGFDHVFSPTEGQEEVWEVSDELLSEMNEKKRYDCRVRPRVHRQGEEHIL